MRIWKGRFSKGLHPEALAFSTSLPVDKRLVEEDIAGSLAHVAMLARQGIVSSQDAASIRRGLKDILTEVRAGKAQFLSRTKGDGRFVAEDVHMAIESRLIKMIGPAGGRLHTARSRNDQVALDERMYLKKVIGTLDSNAKSFQRSLVNQARKHASTLLPGYTHLQRAQPVLLAHHLLAYVAMVQRDRERLGDCLKRAALSPLGAGALAGTSFPIDRRHAAAALSLGGLVENSIDAVSDRDALIELSAACAVIMMHLSRLAEELVLWSSQEWHFVNLGDAFTTGSSIMPQKKNPDMAELVRGKTGRVYGDLVALLTIMKGLPLAYNRDMQEDKEPLFDAVDTTAQSLTVMALMMDAATFDRNRFEEELQKDFLTATEYADYLVRKGIPFRNAHAIVGAIVRHCVDRGLALASLSVEDLKRFSPVFGKDALALARPRGSIAMKRSAGSTGPAEVRKALKRWERLLAK